MHSIGAIAAAAAAAAGSGLNEISSRLPWAWFTLMAVVDVALVMIVVSRRVRGRGLVPGLGIREQRREPRVVRNGWSVPLSKALSLPARQASYAWPLRRDYMVSRLA